MKCYAVMSGDVSSRLLLFLNSTVLLILIIFTGRSSSEVYRSLQWTPENPMFMTNATGCTPQMNVLPSSKLFVICPTPVTVLETVQSTKAKQNLFENLWIVYDKKSFETCNVNTSNAQLLKKQNRQLMQCDEPLELKYFPIVFQQFSAVPGGLEFTPGNTYYFLATSDGTEGSLNDTSGGHCNDTENGVSIKFKVYVCKDENDENCTSENFPLGKLSGCNDASTTTSTSAASASTKTPQSASPSKESNGATSIPVTSSSSSPSTDKDNGTETETLFRKQERDTCKVWKTISICLIILLVVFVVAGISFYIWYRAERKEACPLHFVKIFHCCPRNNHRQVKNKEKKNKEKKGGYPMYGREVEAGTSNKAFDPDHLNDNLKDQELEKENVSPTNNDYVNANDETHAEKTSVDTESHVSEDPSDTAERPADTLFKVAEMTLMSGPPGRLEPLTMTSKLPGSTNGPTDFFRPRLSTFGKDCDVSQNFNEKNV